MPVTISLVAGSAALGHNRRLFFAENVDPGRTKNNVVLADETLEEAYTAAFGDSIQKANESQVRADRRLTPQKYLDKIKKGEDKENNPKRCYEMIIQIGDKDTAGFIANPKMAAKAKDALIDFCQQLQNDTAGHMHIMGAYLHMDESTPHLHIDYIPLAHGYKTGMPVRNSLSKALKQMGYTSKNKKINSITAWQFDLRDKLVETCRAHEIDAAWEKHKTPEKKLTVAEYKKLARIADRKLQQALESYHKASFVEKISGKADNMVKEAYQAVLLKEAALTAAEERNQAIYKDRLSSVESRIQELDSKSRELDERSRELDAEIKEKRVALAAEERERREAIEKAEREHFERMQNEEQQLQERLRNLRILENEAESMKRKAEELEKKAAEEKAAARKYYEDGEKVRKVNKNTEAELFKTLQTVRNENNELEKKKLILKPIIEANEAFENSEERRKYWESRAANLESDLIKYKITLSDANLQLDHSAEKIKSLEKSLNEKDVEIRELKKSNENQISNLKEVYENQLNEASDVIARQEEYINVLLSERAALNNILKGHIKSLSPDEEAIRRAYEKQTFKCIDDLDLEATYKEVRPSDDEIQKHKKDVTRERNRIRTQSLGMER